MKDVLPCDWPQCECSYECERQDKHDEWLKEEERLNQQDRTMIEMVEL